MKKNLAVSVIGALCIALLLVSVASAASKSYYGTTVYYYNGINDFGASWNANYRASTSPATYMDTLGLNVWTAYVSCNGTVQYNTYVQYQVQNQPWLYSHNVTSIANGMAMSKVSCPSQQTRKLNNRTQHYWQDNGHPGAGDTLFTSISG